jgi:hypothetical protein
MKKKVKPKQTCKWLDVNNPKQVVINYIKEIHSEAYYVKWLFRNKSWYKFNQQIIDKFEALYNDYKTKT